MIEKLGIESKKVINWFKNNQLIVNPDKFQAINVNIINKMSDEYLLNIREAKVTSEKSATLSFENKLSF